MLNYSVLDAVSFARIELACHVVTMVTGGESRVTCDHVFTSQTGETGKFSSPGYPTAYPANAYCRYTFQGTADERIEISFSDFDLKPGTDAGYKLNLAFL